MRISRRWDGPSRPRPPLFVEGTMDVLKHYGVIDGPLSRTGRDSASSSATILSLARDIQPGRQIGQGVARRSHLALGMLCRSPSASRPPCAGSTPRGSAPLSRAHPRSHTRGPKHCPTARGCECARVARLEADVDRPWWRRCRSLLSVREPLELHVGAGSRGLRMSDERVERLLVPHPAEPLQSRGVLKTGQQRRRAANHSHRVGPAVCLLSAGLTV
jgi:hypothetical protein